MDEHGNIDERIVAEFESAWIAGTPKSISYSIGQVAESDRTATLIELVLIDLEFGWKKKSVADYTPRMLESYVDEFPQVADPRILQSLLEEEYKVRQKYGDQPKFEEFEQRFSGIIESLEFTQSDEQGQYSTPSFAIELGTIIDNFTIIEAIGEGGMGSVFVAQQTEPVKRKVALKVIKKGANSKEVIARFDAERQALAIMEHQNIAKILDGGSTPDGQPYFVMELVHGTPITEFCDANKLNLQQRLNIFVDVCSAVQHAHQKGVIHRDLKPSNILVAEYDGKLVPKVIDFGLAKALDSEKLLTDQTLATHFGQIVGTFKYMSPEQADSETTDIDTRTDIYALGVILYELLTGSTPIDQATFKNQAILKVLQLIREHDPPRPSTKLSSLNEAASVVSEQRQTDPSRLSRVLKGDLDWVVMKALEKERHRRYETASGFADDVRRYLGNEPVVARPPSTAYKLQKFVRKNRGLVASLATIAALLIAAVVGTSLFAYRAEQAAKSELAQRKIADRKTTEALEQKNLAIDSQKKAEASAKRAAEVLDIVSKSFMSTNPNEGGNANMLAKDVLANAQKAVDQSELDELGRAELFETLTDAFLGLGQFESAIITTTQHIAILESLENPDPESLLRAKLQLANGLMAADEIDKSLEQQRGNLVQSKKQLGDDHPMTLSMLNLLGVILYKKGQFKESLEIRQKVFDGRKKQLGEDHRDTIRSLGNLTMSLHQAGRIDEAVQLKEVVVKSLTEKLGEGHPITLSESNNLAVAYAIAGKVNESFELKERIAELCEGKLGLEHPQTLRALSNLAIGYYQFRNYAKAAEINEQVLATRKKVLGEKHRDTLLTMGNLSIAYDLSDQKEKALELQERTLPLKKEVFGETHPNTLSEMANLAISYGSAGRLVEANELYQSAYDGYVKTLGANHLATIRSATNLGTNLTKLGRPEEARVIYVNAVNAASASLGETHPVTLSAMKSLAINYSNAQETERAIEIDARRFKAVLEKTRVDNPYRDIVRQDLGQLFQHSFADVALLLSKEEYDRVAGITRMLQDMEYAGDELLLPTIFLSQMPAFLKGEYSQSLGLLEPLLKQLESADAELAGLTADTQISIAICQIEMGESESAKVVLQRIIESENKTPLQIAHARIGLADLNSIGGKRKEGASGAAEAFERIESRLEGMNWQDQWLAIAAAKRVLKIVERTNDVDKIENWRSKNKELREQLQTFLETVPD